MGLAVKQMNLIMAILLRDVDYPACVRRPGRIVVEHGVLPVTYEVALVMVSCCQI